jgi:hypothetical protein
MPRSLSSAGLLLTAALFAVPPAAARERGWATLTAPDNLDAWREPRGKWFVAESVGLDPKNPKKLAATPGKGGIIVNGPSVTSNLLSKESFGDVEFHAEFLIPKGSNSGVKFEGLYEIQIADTAGKAKAAGSDCGGIYPRAELLPTYRYLDGGTPPRSNAAKPAGEWQTLDVVFQAPRFDAKGKKTANALFVKVVLNGTVIHEDVEQKTPTGHAWHEKEVPTGPLLLQADHGPVAFRNIRVRPYTPPARDKP